MEITESQADYLRNNHSTKSVHELASKLGVSDYKCLCWLGELGIDTYPYQPLFDFFHNEHSVTLLEGEIDEIIHEVRKFLIANNPTAYVKRLCVCLGI